LPSSKPLDTSPQTGIQAGYRDDNTNPLSPPEAPIYFHAEPAPAQGSQSGKSSKAGGIADLENLISRLVGPETNQTATPPNTQPAPTSGSAQQLTRRYTPVDTVRPPAGRESPSSTEAESTPEVHITIGRLEVNPPSRPAPPPRPRGPAPMSLSDYLDRRNGGRS
jgi:hypothetical protein